jgi:plasmid stabilization system protein ParE
VGAYSFTDNAIRDLDAICDLIAIDNPDAASNLFDDIREQCMRVARFPFSGKKYPNQAEFAWIYRQELHNFLFGRRWKCLDNQSGKRL